MARVAVKMNSAVLKKILLFFYSCNHEIICGNNEAHCLAKHTLGLDEGYHLL